MISFFSQIRLPNCSYISIRLCIFVGEVRVDDRDGIGSVQHNHRIVNHIDVETIQNVSELLHFENLMIDDFFQRIDWSNLQQVSLADLFVHQDNEVLLVAADEQTE
jgi:hypothetical protein